MGLEERFGTIAVKKGFVTKEQVLEGMKVQMERNLDGLEHRLIGSILYSMGYITLPQIDEVAEDVKNGKD
ncbi:MAG: hypothetical protein JRD02_06410 [Deltaproteobacteria bacterium]|nr:hypothetical protein [Deltaproteobacteria bacterium]